MEGPGALAEETSKTNTLEGGSIDDSNENVRIDNMTLGKSDKVATPAVKQVSMLSGEMGNNTEVELSNGSSDSLHGQDSHEDFEVPMATISEGRSFDDSLGHSSFRTTSSSASDLMRNLPAMLHKQPSKAVLKGSKRVSMTVDLETGKRDANRVHRATVSPRQLVVVVLLLIRVI